MKQVININFQGRVVPIESSAYEILKNYIDSLSRHFAAEEGKEEIINDIESRIGELFQESIKAGSTCITDEDVNAIIRNMGRPEDFETEDNSAFVNNATAQNRQQQSSSSAGSFTRPHRLYRDENNKVLGGVCSGLAHYFNIDVTVVRVVFAISFLCFGFGFLPYIILWIAVPSTATTEIGGFRKKLYRDNEDKYIGGVCSGIGHYFGINPWIPRVLFLLPFLSFIGSWNHWYGGFPNFLRLGFSPGALFIYVILWLVLPEAISTTEKLEMKGEKVDMNSIKNSVVEEMKGVQQRAQKFGKEAAATGADAARRGSRSLGDVIIFIIKLIGYVILGSIALALIVFLFVFGITSIGLFPLKDYLLTQGWQQWLAWGTLLFFIITPMIGVITWIIRRLARVKKGSKLLRFGFSAAWILGLICFIFLTSSVMKDFRSYSNINEQEIVLANPSVKSLEITSLVPGQRFTRNRWFSMDPFEVEDDDTAFVRNVSVNIIQSPNDSFRVTMMKLASGRTKAEANAVAAQIPFHTDQRDSVLIIDKALPITKQTKFRNQRVIVTVYVPVGKQIKVHNSIGWSHNITFDGPWSRDWETIKFENLEEGWEEGEWYTMTKDGLVDKDGRPADQWKRENRTEVNVHGKGGKAHISISKDGINIDADENTDGGYRYNSNDPVTNKFDSLKKSLQEQENKYRDSLKKEKEKIDKQLEKIGDKADDGTAALRYSPVSHDPEIFLN